MPKTNDGERRGPLLRWFCGVPVLANPLILIDLFTAVVVVWFAAVLLIVAAQALLGDGPLLGSHIAAACAVGLDGLMNYYREWQPPLPEMERALDAHLQLPPTLAHPYCVPGSQHLLQHIGHDMHHGITATAPGFYGPQGRTIRLHPSIDNLNEKLASFRLSEKSEKSDYSEYSELKITNLEMETSAIYGFAHLLGHEALTACLIIANRPRGTFLNDYHPQMRQLLGTVVERLATS